jgi:hypothetical protein
MKTRTLANTTRRRFSTERPGGKTRRDRRF